MLANIIVLTVFGAAFAARLLATVLIARENDPALAGVFKNSLLAA